MAGAGLWWRCRRILVGSSVNSPAPRALVAPSPSPVDHRWAAAGECDAPRRAARVQRGMHIIFGIAALVFFILGCIGFVGGLSLVFWPLAAVCVALAIKFYPRHTKGPKEGPSL